MALLALQLQPTPADPATFLTRLQFPELDPQPQSAGTLEDTWRAQQRDRLMLGAALVDELIAEGLLPAFPDTDDGNTAPPTPALDVQRVLAVHHLPHAYLAVFETRETSDDVRRALETLWATQAEQALQDAHRERILTATGTDVGEVRLTGLDALNLSLYGRVTYDATLPTPMPRWAEMIVRGELLPQPEALAEDAVTLPADHAASPYGGPDHIVY